MELFDFHDELIAFGLDFLSEHDATSTSRLARLAEKGKCNL